MCLNHLYINNVGNEGVFLFESAPVCASWLSRVSAPVVLEVLHTFSAPGKRGPTMHYVGYGNNIQDRIEPESSSPPKKPSPTQSSSSPVPPSHGSQAAANRRERGNEIPQLTRSGPASRKQQPACTVTPATVTNPPANQSGNFNDSFPRLPLPSPTSKISTEVVGHVDTVVYRLHLT